MILNKKLTQLYLKMFLGLGRMLDVGYQQHQQQHQQQQQGSQGNSPRENSSPSSLQLPQSNSSKEISPVDSPHSHSPPGHPRHPSLQLNHPSPLKENGHLYSLTSSTVPGFPPPMPVNPGLQNTDPFSALGQLGQDLRLTHPHITQWLQQSSGPHSPVKNEPMSPRQDSHSSGSDYAPVDFRWTF